MRYTLILHCVLAALLPVSFSFSQNINALLKKCESKCRAVSGGAYEMRMTSLPPGEKDTSVSIYTGEFQKISGDTLLPMHFRMRRYDDEKMIADLWYNGDTLIEAWALKESVATLYPVERFAADIAAIEYKFRFFLPFTDVDQTPLAQSARTGFTQRYIGEESIGGVRCLHVQLNEPPSGTDGNKMMRNEYHYWIDKRSSLPVRYDRFIEEVFEGDTLVQYTSCKLVKSRMLSSKKSVQRISQPDLTGFEVSEYVRPEIPELLAAGTTAPVWKMKSTAGEEVSLEGLRGKWVLLDFFFVGCPSCTRSIPLIHELKEKYAAKNLVVIGIDPMDKDDDRLRNFIDKHGIAYPILLDSGQEIVRNYHVVLAPTFYLVDPEGKIRYATFGFDDQTIPALDRALGEE